MINQLPKDKDELTSYLRELLDEVFLEYLVETLDLGTDFDNQEQFEAFVFQKLHEAVDQVFINRSHSAELP